MRKIIFILFCVFTYSLMHAQNKIKLYEYWFDNDFSSKVSTNITPVENYNLSSVIPTAGLTGGLHVFNVRFKDDSSRYSQVSSSFFYKQYQGVGPAQNDITQYEYWIDNEYAAKTDVSITAAQSFNLNENIATSSTVPGLHVFNIRFRDSGGKWSQVLSQFFYKSLPGNSSQNDIVEYEYWYDNDHLSKINTAVLPQQNYNLVSNLASTSLPVGLHVVNIRFKDVTGKWSQVMSQFFNKTQSSQSAQKLLTTYQYWYDDDFANHVTQTISPVSNYHLMNSFSTGSLPTGLHTFNVRFKDTNNLWSQILTNFIYKAELATAAINSIVAYRYWVDNDFAAATFVQLPAATSNLNLNTAINMLNVPKGARTFNIQFKDTINKWSVVQSDSFFRIPKPVASFTAGTTSFCDSGSVSFINTSFDTDTYLWDFGDGTSVSQTANPSHTYTLPGTYTVSLVGTDTLMNLQDDTIQAGFIVVGTLPMVHATATDDTLCSGQSIVLSGTGNATSYSWSNGAIDQQVFVPLSSSMYTVTGTNGICSRSDSILITVHALPAVMVGTVLPNDTLCDGESLLLAGSGTATGYTWSGPQVITNNTAFSASASGMYTVTGVDANLCSNTSTVAITVHPIPTFSLGADTSICVGTQLTLSQPFTGANVIWNNSAVDDTIQVSSASNYWCQVTLNGCSYTDSILVGNDSLPVADFGLAISNNIITLTDSSKFGQNIKWYFGDGDSSSQSSPTHSYIGNGSYTLTMIVSNACGSDTMTVNIKVITGLHDMDAHYPVIYPNPANKVLLIDLKGLDEKPIMVSLVDMKGTVILNHWFADSRNHLQFDLTSIDCGIYLLRLESDGRVYVQRINVQH